MKKIFFATITAALLYLAMTSCNKVGCHECHYDGPNGMEDLGEKCDGEIEDLEANGYEVNGTIYPVHCEEH